MKKKLTLGNISDTEKEELYKLYVEKRKSEEKGTSLEDLKKELGEVKQRIQDSNDPTRWN